MNDHTESLEIAGRLRDAVQTLHNMTDDVAKARQIKEFSSERRKNILSKWMLKASQDAIKLASMSSLEMIARSSDGYNQEFNDLSEQHEAAESIIAKWQAEQCRYEAARSLLSFSKLVKDELQG